jgi:hypothetical protein
MVNQEQWLGQAKDALNYCKAVCKNSEDGYCQGVCVRGTGLYLLTRSFLEQNENIPQRRNILDIAESLGDSSSNRMVNREDNLALMQSIANHAYKIRNAHGAIAKRERPLFIHNSNVSQRLRKNGKTKLFY